MGVEDLLVIVDLDVEDVEEEADVEGAIDI